jgi:hypothetical protein
MRLRLPFLALLLAAPVAPAETWTPLWDGNTLKGWRAIGAGTWAVEDGVLVGALRRETPEFGHLLTETAYGDFKLRLKVKLSAGNSGVHFRLQPRGYGGVSGLQLELDAQFATGGLYETNGRGWLVKPSEKQAGAWFKPGDWNELVVDAKNDRVQITVNGQITANVAQCPGPRVGPIGLQLHGGQNVRVAFKDIEIQGTATPMARGFSP